MVNWNLEGVYDTFVRPDRPIVDYNTANGKREFVPRDQVFPVSCCEILNLNLRLLFSVKETLNISVQSAMAHGFLYFFQGHPTTIFGKSLFGRRFEIYNFRNICCKISCLPASPRIFEHLNNGIIAYF